MTQVVETFRAINILSEMFFFLDWQQCETFEQLFNLNYSQQLVVRRVTAIGH